MPPRSSTMPTESGLSLMSLSWLAELEGALRLRRRAYVAVPLPCSSSALNAVRVFPKQSHYVIRDVEMLLDKVRPPLVSFIVSSSLSDQVRMASSTSSASSSGPSSSDPPPWVEECRPCNSEEGQSKPLSSSLGIMTRVNVRAFKALEIMKSCHDFDLTMSIESLVVIWERYSISSEYAFMLHCPGIAHTIYTRVV
ncbi:hypothetical protein GW17_00052432 [Ensete ventricosum]|nr:hypothetical protein GW17_00052432 [Ensete ventricosum]RZR97602.1 hypothetical protein BHM03_00026830 [Ensete ventricosum]